MKRRNWIKYGIGFLFLGAAFITIIGFATMYLWNWLIPTLFNGNTITFIQAIGILALAKILTGFAGWGHRGWGGHRGCYGNRHAGMWKKRWEEKMARMTPEEREKFKSYYYERCGFKYGKEETVEKSEV